MPATGKSQLQEALEDIALYSDTVAGSSSDEESVCTNAAADLKAGLKTVNAPKVSFESIPSRKDHEEFIKSCVDILLQHAVFEGTDRKNKVLEFQRPEELWRAMDLTLRNSPTSHEDLKKLVKDTIRYSVKTGHPYFVNQLFSSVDPYGLVGQWLTDSLNGSVYTYEVAPVFTLMEETVLKEMRTIVGYKNGRGDGIFCPGGSMANGYAMSCALYNRQPDIKTKGIRCMPRLVIFTSEDAHYSIKKFASFLGLGSDNIFLIKTDSRGKMCMEHLKAEVARASAEGALPLMVSATAGTTVFGAFDPLHEIADICEKEKMWFHVDAAWGGGALVSRKHRTLLEGIERSDSIVWNPHKLLCVPQQCSALLLRHEGIMAKAHSLKAAYLFQPDKFYDTKYDTGDKHVQCGRRADVLKFWFMWKAKGTDGFEKHIDKVFALPRFFLEAIKNRPGFELILPEPECTNVCFWYVPPSLRNARDDPDYKERLHRIAPKIKEMMMKEGSMMVSYQAVKGHPNFFRIVFQNSALEELDIKHIVDTIERLGKDL